MELMVLEGSTVSAEVKFSRALKDDVLVTVSSSRDGDPNLVLLSTNCLFFPAQQWYVPQYLVFKSIPDTNHIDGTNVFTLRSSGGLYDVTTIVLREADTNRQGLLVEQLNVSIDEGTTNFIKIRLRHHPTLR